MKQITIGRLEDNDIRINDKSVSRHHGYLLVDGSKIYIVDNDSLNGIYVNEKRINDKKLLSTGDKVRIAKFKLDWQSFVSDASVDADKTIRNGNVNVNVMSTHQRHVSQDIGASVKNEGKKDNEFLKTAGRILKYIITTVITLVIMTLIRKWLM